MVRHGDICLVWENNDTNNLGPASRPIIAVPDQQVRDFYSFVGTYVSNYQPFSAFFRVVQISVLVELLFDRPKIHKDLAEKLIGAIIAETRSQLGTPRRDLSEISIQSCLASLSFPAVAGMVGGVSDQQFAAILENWTKARLILTDESTPISGTQLARFWQIVRLSLVEKFDTEVPGKYKNIVRLLHEVIEGSPDSEPIALRSLTEGLPKSRSALVRMRGSREERVRAIDVIGSEISSSKTDPEVVEVLLGYAASRVAGGSLRYFSLLQEFEQRFPLAPVWFGLFCSLHDQNDALIIGECLGRRVLRHVESLRGRLFKMPTADIAFDEFVNLTSAARPPKWRTEHQTTISVEIFPGVMSAFRLAPRPTQRETNYPEPTIAVETLHEIRSLTLRMLKTLDSVDFPQQGRLFPDTAKTAFLKRSKKSDS
jgi:hypothetical protein